MKNSKSNDSSSFDLMTMHPILRFTIGVALCSIATTYIVLLVIATFGTWRNNLLHITDNLIMSGIIAFGSLIGYGIRRIWMGNLLVALLLLSYWIFLFLQARNYDDIPYMWPLAVSFVGFPVLNTLLFQKWIRTFDLERNPKP